VISFSILGKACPDRGYPALTTEPRDKQWRNTKHQRNSSKMPTKNLLKWSAFVSKIFALVYFMSKMMVQIN
jgi:hypothetical protein